MFRDSTTPSVLKQNGPRISVEIKATSDYIHEASRLGWEFSSSGRISALIDTGSAYTILKPEIVARCKLRHVSFADITWGGKAGKYPVHLAQITFPVGLMSLDSFPVVALGIGQLVDTPYDCLIGRDVLNRWRLTYDGSGIVEIQDL